MTRTDVKFEQRVEEEVRRRVLAILSNAGLPETEVAKEVMYWMPQEFMEFYRDLFLQALQLEGRGREGLKRINSRGEKVPIDANYRVGVGKYRQRKGESDEHFAERTRGMVGASGAADQQRFKEYYVIRDEEAFKLKQLVDRRLQEIATGRVRARETRRRYQKRS